MPEKPLFGIYNKYEKIILLLIGFFLTTVVGSTIAFIYQNRSKEIDQQVQLATEIAISSNKLLNTAEGFVNTLKDNKKYISYKQKKYQYNNSIDNWNTNIDKYFLLIKLFYDEKAYGCMVNNIHPAMVNMGDKIISIQIEHDKNIKADKINKITEQIHSLKNGIYKSEQSMLLVRQLNS